MEKVFKILENNFKCKLLIKFKVLLFKKQIKIKIVYNKKILSEIDSVWEAFVAV